jgi:MoaA/NifB/PqqE/SkfB family radical SAM enzyme
MIKPLANIVRGRPLLAIFEVTLRCNSACRYCDLPLNQGQTEMTREQIVRVFRHLYEEGLRFVLVQGGEPLLRRDLPDVLEDLVGLGLTPTLITNGTRLSHKLVARLATLQISISVSLDTLDRDRYRLIRGADQLRQALAGIDRLSEYPYPKFLTCIVSELNRDEVVDVVRFARQKGFVPVVGAYHWDVERYGKSDPELQYKRSAAIRVFEELQRTRMVPGGYFRDYLADNIRWLGGGNLPKCDAGRYSIAIDCSGNVAPCLALRHTGNLLRQHLDEVLATLDREGIRACSARSSCNMVCSRVIGSTLRHPVSALLTPSRVSAASNAG